MTLPHSHFNISVPKPRKGTSPPSPAQPSQTSPASQPRRHSGYEFTAFSAAASTALFLLVGGTKFIVEREGGALRLLLVVLDGLVLLLSPQLSKVVIAKKGLNIDKSSLLVVVFGKPLQLARPPSRVTPCRSMWS